MNDDNLKKCYVCKQQLPVSKFHNSSSSYDGLQGKCKSCNLIWQKEWKHRTGRQIPMSENKMCSSYLGVYIAEKLLSAVFKTVERMPYANPGFDFVCGKGYKIDVKCAVARHGKDTYCNRWQFPINNNRIPDFFALVGIDNRASLQPQHFWIIPQSVANDTIVGRLAINIGSGQKSLTRWKQYENPIDRVIEECNLLKVVI